MFAINWSTLFEMLALIIVISFAVERALALVFESNWFIDIQKGRDKDKKGTFKPLIAFVAWAVLFIVPVSPAFSQELQLDYDGFTVWMDCSRRGAVRFEYTVGPDTGSLPRRQSFSLDPDVDDDCQQTSASTYSHRRLKFDRGHMVPANHLDHRRIGIRESNFMTNVLPQARNMNRGAWLRTEEIIECHREQGELIVIGGVTYGFNPHDDIFMASHGIETPDYFWKIVLKDDDAIAWIIPNVKEARKGELDRYLIRISDLEDVAGESFDIAASLKNIERTESWQIPSGCDFS